MHLHPLRRAARPAALICTTAAMAACAGMASAPAATANGALTDAAGRTLYTFDRDTAGSGKSACNGPCIGLWPAFTASGDAKATGDYTIVTRDDGSRQWAHKGRPLYTFSRDAKPGDRTGDGFNNDVWHLAKP